MNPFQMLGAMKNPQAFIQQMMNSTPTMTREKLIEELSINRYSSIALVMIAENVRQES